jgi:hypothetical protein
MGVFHSLLYAVLHYCTVGQGSSSLDPILTLHVLLVTAVLRLDSQDTSFLPLVDRVAIMRPSPPPRRTDFSHIRTYSLSVEFLGADMVFLSPAIPSLIASGL